MNSNQRNQTTTSQPQIVFEVETPYDSAHELMEPDLEVLYGDLTEEQQAQVGEAHKHILAEALILYKAGKATDGLLRYNVHMGEQFTEAMIRHDMTETRVMGRPCEDEVRQFLKQRRRRPMVYLDKLEERTAIQVFNEAARSVYPKPKVNDSKLNLIFRLFTSERTKISQATEQDERLPMTTGTLFGTRRD